MLFKKKLRPFSTLVFIHFYVRYCDLYIGHLGEPIAAVVRLLHLEKRDLLSLLKRPWVIHYPAVIRLPRYY